MKKSIMTQLLEIVNNAYPDGMVAEYIDLKTGESLDGLGATLAQFVAIETREVGGDEGSLKDRRLAVAGAFETAIAELEQVVHALKQGVK